jgi:hypothetical protein
MPESNPIIETYKGVAIRKYSRLYIRVSVTEMKKFIDAHEKYNLSEREILELISQPCPCSKDINAVSYDNEGQVISIPRGILSKKF